MPTTQVPGHPGPEQKARLRETLRVIKEEYALMLKRDAAAEDYNDEEDRVLVPEQYDPSHVTWRQTVWATVIPDLQDPGMEVESMGVDDSHWDRERFILPPVSCGTGQCFAGHVTTLNGDRLIVDAMSAVGLDKGETTTLGALLRSDAVEADVLYCDNVIDKYGEVHHIEMRAADLLGITYAQSRTLFAPENSIEQLEELVASLVEDRMDEAGEVWHDSAERDAANASLRGEAGA